MGQLPIMFFIPGRVAQKSLASDPVPPALRAFRRLSLRSSLLQARRAGSVRLCSHTRPGLLAHCSPLLAARQQYSSVPEPGFDSSSRRWHRKPMRYRIIFAVAAARRREITLSA